MADDRRAASPVGLHVGGGTGVNTITHSWNPAGNLLQWSSIHLNFVIRFIFLLIKTPEAFANISPFLIEKAFTSSIGRSRRFVRCAPGTCSSKCHRRNRRPHINLQK
ncbi:hypothetical protein TNCV_657321 [Trichonephila clavipes]|nr:hypothetical protein TNCV_657321 [Trichonephila clavipes]